MHAADHTAIDAAGTDLVGDAPTLVRRQGEADGLPVDHLAFFQGRARRWQGFIVAGDERKLIDGLVCFGHPVFNLQQADRMAEEATSLARVVNRREKIGELEHQIGIADVAGNQALKQFECFLDFGVFKQLFKQLAPGGQFADMVADAP